MRRMIAVTLAVAALLMISGFGQSNAQSLATQAAAAVAVAGPTGPVATAIGYRSNVTLDPERHWLRASTTASLKINSATSQVTILLNPALAVERLTVAGVPSKFKRSGTLITVDLPAKAEAGDVILVGVDYAGELVSQGWGLRGHVGDEGIFVSREAWLPCDENWSDGDIPSDLTVDLPAGYTLVNLGQVTNSAGEAGRQRLQLTTTDLNIVAGVYDYRQIIAGSTRVELYTYAAYPEVGRILADEIPRAFSFLRRTLGDAPVDSLVIANMPAVPGFGGGVAYRNMIGLVPDYRNARGYDVYSVLPHELAHRWQQARLSEFAGPGSLWLTEGTATYVGWLYLEDRFGVERFRDTMSESAEVYWRDRLIDGTGSVLDFERNQRADLRYGTVYLKGAWTLHMFRQLIGDEAFADYLREHLDWRARDLDDWVGMCSRLAGFDVKPYFDNWLRADGSQRLTVEGLTGAQADGRYRATFDLVAAGPAPRRIDIEFSTPAGGDRITLEPTGARTAATADLPEQPAGATVDPDRWLLLPPGDRPDLTAVGGNLTVNYDPVNRSLAGSAQLSLRNELGPRPAIRLSLNTGLTVTAVSVRGMAAQYIQSTRDVVIMPSGGMNAGETCDVSLSYEGWPVAIGVEAMPANGALPATALWYPSLTDLTWPGGVTLTVPAGVALTGIPGWERQRVGGVTQLTRIAPGPATISVTPVPRASAMRNATVAGGLILLAGVTIVIVRRARR